MIVRTSILARNGTATLLPIGRRRSQGQNVLDNRASIFGNENLPGYGIVRLLDKALQRDAIHAGAAGNLAKTRCLPELGCPAGFEGNGWRQSLIGRHPVASTAIVGRQLLA